MVFLEAFQPARKLTSLGVGASVGPKAVKEYFSEACDMS